MRLQIIFLISLLVLTPFISSLPNQANNRIDFPEPLIINYYNYTINGTEVVHNNLNGLQGGTANQRYHIQQSWYDELTTNIFNWITDLSAFTTDDLAQGTNNFYDNMTWNESYANSLYVLNGTLISGLWESNGTNIYNSTTDFVGIGTSTPTAKLEVVGNINFTDNGVSIFSEGGTLVISG